MRWMCRAVAGAESANSTSAAQTALRLSTICVNFRVLTTKLCHRPYVLCPPHFYGADIFEDFITLLSGLNKKQTPLVINSFYIIDDAKQRDKMTEEFYLAVKKEIAAYQEKCDYLIKSSSQKSGGYGTLGTQGAGVGGKETPL